MIYSTPRQENTTPSIPTNMKLLYILLYIKLPLLVSRSSYFMKETISKFFCRGLQYLRKCFLILTRNNYELCFDCLMVFCLFDGV